MQPLNGVKRMDLTQLIKTERAAKGRAEIATPLALIGRTRTEMVTVAMVAIIINGAVTVREDVALETAAVAMAMAGTMITLGEVVEGPTAPTAVATSIGVTIGVVATMTEAVIVVGAPDTTKELL